MRPARLNDIEVRSTILYGILVTAKSFCTGMRITTLRQHAELLAIKVTGHRLPRELADIVKEFLMEGEDVRVMAAWNPKFRTADGIAKFLRLQGRLEPGECKMAKDILWFRKHQVQATAVQVSNPKAGTDSQDKYGRSRTYVHLSCTKTRPSLAMNIPHAAGPVPMDIPRSVGYFGSKGLALASCAPPRPVDVVPVSTRAHDTIVFKQAENSSSTMPSGTSETQVSRLMQCDDVEEAIKAWDAESIEKVVRLLELKVVAVGKDDALKPKLHILQSLSI